MIADCCHRPKMRGKALRSAAMRPGSMRLFPAILCAPCPPPRLTTFEIRARQWCVNCSRTAAVPGASPHAGAVSEQVEQGLLGPLRRAASDARTGRLMAGESREQFENSSAQTRGRTDYD